LAYQGDHRDDGSRDHGNGDPPIDEQSAASASARFFDNKLFVCCLDRSRRQRGPVSRSWWKIDRHDGMAWIMAMISSR
jgi:hypothetical protein